MHSIQAGRSNLSLPHALMRCRGKWLLPGKKRVETAQK
jgi:hypothetical protein